MPLEKSVLGFANRWYPEALKNTELHVLGEGLEIRVVKPLFFMATKFEAFHGRSEGDYYCKDIEDIVCLLEHRKALAIELLDAPETLHAYLKEEFSLLLNSDFLNLLPGLVDGQSSAAVVKRQLELMIKA
jgi:predicted nucleotidyltransferase